MKTSAPLRPAILYFLSAILVFAQSAHAQRDFGVDVSHFQGAGGISSASWNLMYVLDSKHFAYVKATEGLTGPDDAPMATNVVRAVAVGMRAGVYHYAHPENRPTTNGAVLEADHFLTYAGNYIGPGYLRPVLDLESAAAALTTTQLSDWVIAFRNEIVAQRGPGAAPIVYCSQFFATNELDSRMAGLDLWVRYTGSGLNPTNDTPPATTGAFTNWAFWQYSDTGSSGGINPIDFNVCHTEFHTLDSYLIPTIPSPQLATVTTPPQSQSVSVGSSANFSVAISASSTPPVGYQWLFNGTNIPGATLSTYTKSSVQIADGFSGYSVVVTNPAGSVTSVVATLTVLTPVSLWSQDFDSYSNTGPSIVTAPGLSDGFKILYQAISNGIDFTAQFGFDYSTVTFPTNIPPAPHTTNGTTLGLYLTVNKDGAPSAAAVNLYPTGQVFSGSFSLKFDMWINWTNLNTSTEHTMFGINHSGNVTNRVGLATSDGLFFVMDGDGGSSPTSATLRDYSVFLGTNGAIPILVTNPLNFSVLLGSQFDNANSGFTTLFPSKTVPGYSNTVPAGSAGLGWVTCEVRQETNLITWLLNDTIVAQYSNGTAFTNGDIMVGYNDAFASIGSVNNFVIIDNLRVETVNPDLDGDGLPDAWEAQYFGNLNSNGSGDADGDGASNLQEYLAGTNPTNSLSSFRLLSATKIGDDMRLDWTTVGGRSYVVQVLTNAVSGTFFDLSTNIPVSGTGDSTNNYVHAGGATNKGAFYRIRLGP